MSIRYFLKDLELSSNNGTFVTQLKYFLCSHTIHMTLLVRLGQSIKKLPFLGGVLRIIIEYIIRILFSSDISCRANIAPGLIIMHGHDIVIGADVVIGKNCKIFNGVTFGNKDLEKASLGNQPIVGDNCIICTGAKILGKIKIEDNVVIAANAVVLKDCLRNTVHGGVPAKVINGNY